MSDIKTDTIANKTSRENREAITIMVANYLGSEAVETTPFTEATMSKDEMVAHIIQVHGHRGPLRNKAFGLYDTKVTKSEMVEWHNNVHDVIDSSGDLEVSNFWNDGVYVRPLGHQVVGVPLPKVRHIHMAYVPLSPEQEQTLRAVRDGKKADGVLSANERKVLTQVVDNDFGSLKQEMRAFAADTLTARKTEINADWDDKEKSIPDFASGATELKRAFDERKRVLRAEFDKALKELSMKYEDDHRGVVVQAKNRGVTLEGKEERVYNEQKQEYQSRTVFQASVEGRKEALSDAEKQNDAMLNRALMDLEKQRLTAQRQVLLSGVPEAAMPILDGIPDAKSLMLQSAEQSMRNQIEVSQQS